MTGAAARPGRLVSAPVDVDDLDRHRDALQGLAPAIRGPMRLTDGSHARDDVARPPEGGDTRRLVHALAGEVPRDLRRVGRVKPDADLRCEALRRAMLGKPPL